MLSCIKVRTIKLWTIPDFIDTEDEDDDIFGDAVWFSKGVGGWGNKGNEKPESEFVWLTK